MFCVIKYSDCSEKTETDSLHSYTTTSMHSLRSLNAEQKELLINPNCQVRLLLDYICESLGLEKNTEFTLCDERGILTNINKCRPNDYATDVLKPKHTYFVVVIENDSEGKLKKLKPLISKQTKLYSEIMPKLKKNLSTTNRRVSTETKRSNASIPSARKSSTSPSNVVFSKTVLQ